MTVLIIDGNPICHRAYHVFDMQTSIGLQSGIVFGSLGIIQSLLELGKFEDIIFCWDSGTPRLRSILYPAYKQKPPLKEGEKSSFDPEVFYSQMNSVYSILEAVGVKQFKIKGVEADDLIGIVTRRLFELDYSVAIAGNDVDLYQLIRGEDVVIYDTREKRWINENAAIKKIGVTPKQIVDLKALMGDPSDNIPGAKGIGKVTAKNLINEFGSVEAFLNGCEFDKADKRTKGALKDYRSILFSKTLVQIITQPEDLGEGGCVEFKNQWQSNFYGEKIINQAEAMAVMDMYEIQKFADPELFNQLVEKVHGGGGIPVQVREGEIMELGEVSGMNGENVIPGVSEGQIQVVLGQVKCPDRGEIKWKQCIKCKWSGSVNYDSGHDEVPQSIDCTLKIGKND